MAAAALTVTACGRSADNGAPPARPGQAVSTGKATGTITVWAMGAEGDKLPAARQGVRGRQPRRQGQRHRDPVGRRPRQVHRPRSPPARRLTPPWSAPPGWASSPGIDALDPTPAVDRQVRLLRRRPEDHRGERHLLRHPVVRRDPAGLLPHRPRQEGRLTTPPTDWEGLKTWPRPCRTKAGAKWGIGLQAGGTGLVAVRHAVRVVQRRRPDQGRRQGLQLRQPRDARGGEVLPVATSPTASPTRPPRRPPTTEPDFVSGKVPMFISGPWMMSAVEKVGGAGFKDKYDVMPIPAKTDVLVLRRRLRPRRLQEHPSSATPPGSSSSGSPTPRPRSSGTSRRPTCPPSSRPGRTRPSPRTRSSPTFGKQLETAQAPPSLPDVGAGRRQLRHRDGEGHQDRAPTPLRRSRPCSSRPTRSGPASTAMPPPPRRPPAGSPAGDTGTAARAEPRREAARREGRAAWILALPFCLLFLVFTLWPVVQSLFMSFTDTKARDLRQPVRGQRHRPGQLHQGAVRPDLPQGGAQHRLLRRRRHAADPGHRARRGGRAGQGHHPVPRRSSGSASTCR